MQAKKRTRGRAGGIFLIGVVLAMVLLLGACSDLSTAQVRFRNSSTLTITHGIRLGTAEFYPPSGGTLGPGTVTSYQTISPGSYRPELRLANGTWAADTLTSFPVTAGRSYTLTILGSSSFYYYSLDRE